MKKLFKTIDDVAFRVTLVVLFAIVGAKMIGLWGDPPAHSSATMQYLYVLLFFAVLGVFAGFEQRSRKVELLEGEAVELETDKRHLSRVVESLNRQFDKLHRDYEALQIAQAGQLPEGHTFTGAQLDTLIGLIERGPLWDGDVPSKSGRDQLINAGLARRVIVKGEDGFTAATYAGRDAYKAKFAREGENLWRAIQNRKAGAGIPPKQLVNICGRDCKPGDGECNGYCTGKTDTAKRYDGPPKAPRYGAASTQATPA